MADTFRVVIQDRGLIIAFLRIGAKPVEKLFRKFSFQQPKALKDTPYPPKLPNQVYERTFRFANSWLAQKVSDTENWILNTAKNPKSGKFYPGWVAGIKQADIHKGRWWQAHKVLLKRLPKFEAMLDSFLKRAWRGGP